MSIAVVQGGAVQFVRADHIDRPVSATNAAGAMVWQQAYDPFGQVVSGLGSDARFAGQWFAAENGLHQNWMRDYDATLGRYIQADPLGLVDGASVYGYALQNPARWSDPRGEEALSGALLFGGSAALADGPLPFGEILGICAIAVAVIADCVVNEVGICAPEPVLPNVSNSKYPPGYWSGPEGAKEWGRRNGVPPNKAKEKFHKTIKEKNKGAGAKEDFGVNPATGDVIDGNGESAGNMDE